MTTNYTHPAYGRFEPLWAKVRDACAGEDAVKSKGQTYLPNPDEESNASAKRYDRYLARAVYFNATGRTLQGLIGIAFGNWPTVEIREKRLLEDADGSGVGLIGQAQWMLAEVLQTGRGGLLADWTKTDGVQRTRTLAQAEAAGWRPYVSPYSAEQILTWEHVGGRLTRLVLAETAQVYEGGEVKDLEQLRELLIIEGKYVIKVWQRHTKEGQFLLIDTVDTGLAFIPFAFVGAINNDAHPDTPPLLDLANMNLAHYRNSADFEESAFLMGQPMLVLTGVTEEWVEKRGAIIFGSRAALPLPQGGDAQLLQASGNTLAKEAMLDKERMMAMLGARMLAPGEAAKTATQSAAETRSAYSALSLACDNVSQAYSQAMRWADNNGAASFAIDTKFADFMLDANAIRATVEAWQAGIVPQSDAVASLQRLGVIDQGKTAEQVAGEVEAQGPALSLDEAA